jgi:antiviral helicase SLH1
MSPAALATAEAEWQTQLAAMRAALADLKLPQSENGEMAVYGSDIPFDDDDDFTSGNSGDDVWDFITDDDDALYSSDLNEDIVPEEPTQGYGPQWLKSKCDGFAAKKQGLSGEDLHGQIVALLASDSVEEELQSTLTDIVGFDDLDFVIELISHRKEIIERGPLDTNKDGVLGRLQTKRQREEALRQRDYEHKHAELGPAVNRDEIQYPHVYKAHPTAGNTLDSRGKKYALPVGHERKDHEVSSFFFQYLKRFIFLIYYRDMKSIQFQPPRLACLEKAVSWSKSRRWTVSAGEHSKATSL